MADNKKKKSTVKKTASRSTASKSAPAKRTTSNAKQAKQQQIRTPAKAAVRVKKEHPVLTKALPYILIVIGVLIGVCCIFGEGNVGGAIKNFLTGLFSAAAYGIPLLLIIRALLLQRDRNEGQSVIRSIGYFLVLLFSSAVLHILAGGAETIAPWEHYIPGQSNIGGGFFGGFVGQLLLGGFGKVAALIILFVILTALVLYIGGFTPRGIIIWIRYKLKVASERRAERKQQLAEQRQNAPVPQRKLKEEEYLAYLKEKRKKNRIEEYTDENTEPAVPPVSEPQPEMKAGRSSGSSVYKVRKLRLSELEAEIARKQADISDGAFDADIDIPDVTDSADGADDVPAAGTPETDINDATQDMIDEQQFEEVMRRTQERMDNSRFVDHHQSGQQDTPVSADAQDAVDATPVKDSSGLTVSQLNIPVSQNEPNPDADIFVNPNVEAQISQIQQGLQNPGSSELGTLQKTQKSVRKKSIYKFPPIDLLTKAPKRINEDVHQEIVDNGRALVETLRNFKINTKIQHVERGPVITRYELKPEAGIKVSTIRNLTDDIAMSLKSVGVRIEAPIPGKGAVGVEVPNKKPTIVYLRSLLENRMFTEEKKKLFVAIGEDVGGNPVYINLNDMPHLLIAGATNSGKSVCINSIIISLLYKSTPEDVKMILIDPKQVEFLPFQGIPHLLVPVVNEPKKAAGALSWAVSEMERRYSCLKDIGVRKIDEYNAKVKNNPNYETLPYIVIIIDELADLMETAQKDVEESIRRLAAKSRAAGIHLILGTQRPSVDVISGTIKTNIPSRIAFKTASAVDSKTIIDFGAAANLIGKGDMLIKTMSGAYTNPTRVQGSFIDTEEIYDIVDYIKRTNDATEYSEEVANMIAREAQRFDKNKDSGPEVSDENVGSEDPMLKDALELAVENGKISTSLIQRKLSLGYGRAAKLIDRMEQLGYVSAPDGQKPREVLITKQQFMEMRVNDEV